MLDPRGQGLRADGTATGKKTSTVVEPRQYEPGGTQPQIDTQFQTGLHPGTATVA